MNGLLRRLLALWVRFKIRPENAAELVRGCAHPLCYLLEWRSVSDLAVLQAACERLQLPRAAPQGARPTSISPGRAASGACGRTAGPRPS